MLMLAPCLPAQAADARSGVGVRYSELSAGKKTFHNVVIRDVTARSISFTHDGGLASLPLRELTPELQAFFGYSAEAEAAAEEKARQAKEQLLARQAQQKEVRSIERELNLANRFERLVQDLGQPPRVHEQMDLRPRFRELSLFVKDQGRRPSCSIFAVVSALEFLNAQLSGTPEKLSEEYLVWATQRTLRRGTPSAMAAPDATDVLKNENADAGFTLGEVVSSLRAFGIPLQDSMPNTFGTGMSTIADPAPELVNEARSRRKVFVHALSSRNRELQIANMVHALNAEIPVVIGLRWPHARTVRTGYLSQQKPLPDYGHAVTLVGYQCENRRIEDAVFFFKNSYGIEWGQGGYGTVTYAYLRAYLLDAVLLEVQRGET